MEERKSSTGKKSVLSCESGRMIIVEESETPIAGNAPLSELAQNGKEEGYILFSELPACPLDDCDGPGMFLSILTRPALPVQEAGILPVVAAVAVARAIEKLSESRIRIRWVNDLFHGEDKLCSMVSSTRLSPEGQLEYAVIGMSLCLSSNHFPPKLGDVIRRVFNGELRELPSRLSDAIALEFFSIYDRLKIDRSFMEEYRLRSMIIGKRVKVLVGDTYIRGRVIGIDDHACLTVELRSGAKMTIASRSEIVF
ncbi:MAG: hypothetical protein IJY20_04295 [Clostridia bacterium]|nr:hypothetical protein [Clostridia bacterium]